MADHHVRVRTWVRGNDDEIRTGLLGYISVEFGNLILDGIVLRKTIAGRFALSFPQRRDNQGHARPYIRPIDDEARREIEAEILWQLGEREDLGVATDDGHE